MRVVKPCECDPNFIWNNKGAVERKWTGWTWSGRGERKCRRQGEDSLLVSLSGETAPISFSEVQGLISDNRRGEEDLWLLREAGLTFIEQILLWKLNGGTRQNPHYPDSTSRRTICVSHSLSCNWNFVGESEPLKKRSYSFPSPHLLNENLFLTVSY